MRKRRKNRSQHAVMKHTERKKQVRAVSSLCERQREETGRTRSNLRADGAPQHSGKINLTAAASAPEERRMEEDRAAEETEGKDGSR